MTVSLGSCDGGGGYGSVGLRGSRIGVAAPAAGARDHHYIG